MFSDQRRKLLFHSPAPPSSSRTFSLSYWSLAS